MGHDLSYKIKNKSLQIEISLDIDKSFQDYLKVLEELPDPKKIYEIKHFFKKNTNWKLIYNADTQLLQWENQADNSKQSFIIETPLKIGDKTAIEST